jgi:hypothetical protein
MGRKAPKPQPEDPSVIRTRERSILDLAKLDEEENARIKQLRSASRGVRAFRAMRSGSGSASVIGTSTGAGSSGGGDSGAYAGRWGYGNWGPGAGG